MLLFGVVQIVLSQIPEFRNIQWLSILATAMSFTYSSIRLGLGLAKVRGMLVNSLEYYLANDSTSNWKRGGGILQGIRNLVVILFLFLYFILFFSSKDNNFLVINFAGDGYVKGSIGGISTSSAADKVWLVSQALGLGGIAFANPYPLILIEIQVWHVKVSYGWNPFQKSIVYITIQVLKIAKRLIYMMHFAKHEGYFEVTSTRKPGNEKGLNNSNHSYNPLLPQLWRLWICSLWGWFTWELLDGVWILWTTLAHWIC